MPDASNSRFTHPSFLNA
ncbi:unnamed protein product [Acanthoscelides obtectus]|uniref:Uncharacterized protein n=1 Tax=Acanthoscelides obtectus TaxID=200917 RepID=A0A9P0K125_ACAOB|nr:unnamed protein product [Acanthoscelides obtectus]CAK1649343.1 hypothetical protein AOBTE_LOCUS16174 [Acanthoscelides obtectus]